MTTRVQQQNEQLLPQSQRPRSAAYDSGRLNSQPSLSKFVGTSNQALDEKTVSSIWQGFGSYIAKQMRNGKGILVPKFGNFTFTAPVVDLACTTNPQERDQQVRVPVFIVGKDFVSAVSLKPGISPLGNNQVRPYEQRGSSGIIPCVKINYTEVAVFCSQSKDICRSGCEQVFRFLSDKVRKGEQVQMDIPLVGTFFVRNNLAAISFSSNLQQQTRGITPKGYLVNKLFANSVNRLNMQVHEQGKVKLNPSAGMGGAMRLTGDAESWLKTNLNISIQELAKRPQSSYFNTNNVRNSSVTPVKADYRMNNQGLNRYSSMKPEDLKKKSWNIGTYGNTLTEQNKEMFDRISDTKSNRNGPRSQRPLSAAPSQGSRISQVPELGRMKLMIIANDIFRNRAAISEVLNKLQSQSMRNVMSSSEIQNVLKKTGIFIEIGVIKAFLKELGFNWNGPACSFYELFNICKNFIYGQSQEEERANQFYSSYASPKDEQNEGQQLLSPTGVQTSQQKDKIQALQKEKMHQLIKMIKDLIYATRKNIYDLFNLGKLGQNMDLEGFQKVVSICCQGGQIINEEDLKEVFQFVTKHKSSLTYQDFEKLFKWNLPAGGDWETNVIRIIRDWILKKNYSSESAFDILLQGSGRILQKKMNRIDFHKGILSQQELANKLSAPEIDALFNMLDTTEEGEIDLSRWQTRIYEDSGNPLQMLRQIVIDNKLTPDDLIFKMKIRYWDEPMDLYKLTEVLRRLDSSLSETQLRHLQKTLRNKENKVEVNTLLRNLCGQEHETIDFRNKIFRKIYTEIHPNKEDALIQEFENSDPLNDGRLEPTALKICLKKVLKNLDEETIDRFIRFLDKDRSGKVNYMEFLQHMSEVSNRDHNPFRSIVQRIAYFIQQNKQTPLALLKRLSTHRNEQENQNQEISDHGVTLDTFTQFLKTKIDKKRPFDQLRQFSHFIDIDKDGFVSETDLNTCLGNLKSEAFFKNGGSSLAASSFASQQKFYPSQNNWSDERANEVVLQIRNALIGQKIAYREAFNRFDLNKDGFLNFQEFSQGIDKVINLSELVKEKLFALMDRNQIGLVDYQQFLQIIQMSTANKLKKEAYSDNFDWEESVIEKIREWIRNEKITVEEAFKSFDKDFDGQINKEDLRWSLINIFNFKPDQIYPTKLDRLFRLMDFYKSGLVKLSDFQRFISNENPYTTMTMIGTLDKQSPYDTRNAPSTVNFRKSFGGGFTQVSTFDWKLSAIQQFGLVISKKFKNVKESFEDASEKLGKITFDQFKKFVEKYQTLAGFNLTITLIQKLFSEIDPHKKGFLTENDWTNAFKSFNVHEQILIELKNSISCSFSDCDSAFEFFCTFKKQQQQQKQTSQIQQIKKDISYPEFENAVNSLTTDRFQRHEIQTLWKHLTDNGRVQNIDKYQFRSHFDQVKYTGASTVRNLKSAPPGARTTIYTQDSSNSTWNEDILEKLRKILAASTQNLEDIFKEFDLDQNGTISQVEFRNALRKLNLSLTSRELDKILQRIDTNQDGKIDWKEFVAQFKRRELDDRLRERAKDKMARLKEMMILHMGSMNDAFRYFDESKLGKLTYQEFSKLIIQLYSLANQKAPAYPVIKDMFDIIDIRKDGIIDIKEWQQTFGHVSEGNNQLSIKPTPLLLWENSREFQDLGVFIAKNRKSLREQFEKDAKQNKVLGFDEKDITFDQANSSIMKLVKNINPDKIKCLLRVAEIPGSLAAGAPRYDYMRLLELYKERYAGPQI